MVFEKREMILPIIYRALNIQNGAEVTKVAEIHEDAPRYWIPDHSATMAEIQRRVEQLKNLDGCIDRFSQVAEGHKGTIIGFHWIDLEKENGDIFGHIKSLWVDDDFRHNGIATQLKCNGEKWAISKGAAYLKTTVHANNHRMLEFNLYNGFEQGFIEMVKKLK